MSCQEIEALLDEYVDEELSPDERLRVERHLADCSACRKATDEIRSLVDAASKLPRGISPGRDLYPDIRNRIERHEVAASPDRAVPPVRRIPWMALAASLVVVAIAGSTALWLRDDADRRPSDVAPTGAAMPAVHNGIAPFKAAVHEYAEAADVLLAAIEERRDRFSPETLAVLEKNLAIIDQAIDEVRVALEADPSSHGTTLLLAAMHEQKVELLRRVARLSS
jgi:anti-sigma factor RsiW